jgi:hypothetical protein
MAEVWLYYGVVVGLAAVGLALFDRGYGDFRTARKSNPDLKFTADYIVNIIVAAGGAGGFFGVAFPVILNAITKPAEGMDVIWIILQFVSAYFATIGILDKLNKSTEAKTEAAVFKKLAVNSGAVTIGDINKGKVDITGDKKEGNNF